MPRVGLGWWWWGVLVATGCNDELSEVVPKDVCYSERRWIGGKRGSEEMYPGGDCVGCHLDNDGPQLVLGGTLYPYVFPEGESHILDAAQSGEHCYGVEGISITIEDGAGQIFEVVTNRAGNFFVEGNPADFAKPFTARIDNFQKTADGAPVAGGASMRTPVFYGGCAHCHDPRNLPFDPAIHSLDPADGNYRIPKPAVGLPGYYEPENYPTLTVEAELREIARSKGIE